MFKSPLVALVFLLISIVTADDCTDSQKQSARNAAIESLKSDASFLNKVVEQFDSNSTSRMERQSGIQMLNQMVRSMDSLEDQIISVQSNGSSNGTSDLSSVASQLDSLINNLGNDTNGNNGQPNFMMQQLVDRLESMKEKLQGNSSNNNNNNFNNFNSGNECDALLGETIKDLQSNSRLLNQGLNRLFSKTLQPNFDSDNGTLDKEISLASDWVDNMSQSLDRIVDAGQFNSTFSQPAMQLNILKMSFQQAANSVGRLENRIDDDQLSSIKSQLEDMQQKIDSATSSGNSPNNNFPQFDNQQFNNQFNQFRN